MRVVPNILLRLIWDKIKVILHLTTFYWDNITDCDSSLFWAARVMKCEILSYQKKTNDKPMFHVSQIDVWPGQPQPYETVPIRTKKFWVPLMIEENHQALAAKGEKHPMCSIKFNPAAVARTRTQVLVVRGERVIPSRQLLNIVFCKQRCWW